MNCNPKNGFIVENKKLFYCICVSFARTPADPLCPSASLNSPGRYGILISNEAGITAPIEQKGDI